MNKKTLTLLVGAIAIIAVAFQSCQPQESELKQVYLDLPTVPEEYFQGANNHIPTLGRVLFYDRQLSINNSVACASCHKQALGFADNVALSRGFENTLTTRNSMPIQNLQGFFFGNDP